VKITLGNITGIDKSKNLKSVNELWNRTLENANMKWFRKPTEPFNKMHFIIEKSNTPEWFAYIYI
jgi:hypothetical protein